MKIRIVVCLFYVLTMMGCGPQIYQPNQFDSITASHKTIAILPAKVNIQLRPNEMKKIDMEQLRENEKVTGFSIQDKMYSWFLRRSDKFKYTVAFQDISKTNAILEKKGITYANIKSVTKEELCKILEVDAVISSSFDMKKPMSDGAAVALGVAFGVWGSTNDVQTFINIHEVKEGQLIWKYDWVASGSVGSNTDRLVNELMRNVSRRFPYNGKK